MTPRKTSGSLLLLTLLYTPSLSAQDLQERFWWINSPKRFDMVLLMMKSQQIEYARRQQQLQDQARLRAEALRRKAAELLVTVRQLNERLDNPRVVSAETPQLARRCENLSKEIKKLLKKPR